MPSLTGPLVAHFGWRRVGLVSTLLMTFFFLILAFAHTPTYLFLFYGFGLGKARTNLFK